MGTAVIMIWLITMLSCNATIFHSLAERLVNSLPQNVTGILFPSPGSNESYYQRLEIGIITNNSITTDSPSVGNLTTFSVTRIVHHAENVVKTTRTIQRKITREHSVTHSSTQLPLLHSVIGHSLTRTPFPLPENPKHGILITVTAGALDKGAPGTIKKKTSKNSNKPNNKMINFNNKRRKRMGNKILPSSRSSIIANQPDFKIVLNLTMTRDILSVSLVFHVFYFISCLSLYLGTVKVSVL